MAMKISFKNWQVLHHPDTGMWRRVRWFGRWTPFVLPLKSQTASELVDVYRTA
jgi:hypothetical protein